MTSDLRFGLADAATIPALVALINRAYRTRSDRSWTSEDHLLAGPRTDAAALAELLQAPPGRILTAHNSGNELVGCVYLEPNSPSLYLGLLAVDPVQQALGVGRQLLGAAEEVAVQERCQEIVITVLSARLELLAWYERHGFRRTGETEPFPNDPRLGQPRQPLSLLVLRKALP